MDELAERAKLALLDLTDDVIELIIDKKRKAFAKKQEEAAAAAVVVVPVLDEIPEIEEPTYYPPEPKPIPLPQPVIPEPPMAMSMEPIMRWSALKRRMVRID